MRMKEYTDDQLKTGDWVKTISEQSYRGWHAFYHTSQWKSKRLAVLKRDHYQCQICRQKIPAKYSKATTVHHIKHLKDVPELALTDSNLISLCEDCHKDMHPELANKPRKPSFTNKEHW